jgi:hypothetical protein
MAGLFNDAEEERVAKWQVNYDGGGTDLTLKLFASDTTPADSDLAATFTEASFVGYSAITLTGASWTITQNAPTSATYSAQTFSSTADQTASSVYGYYITRSTDLVFAERFTDGPYTIETSSDYIVVAPNLYYKKSGE